MDAFNTFVSQNTHLVVLLTMVLAVVALVFGVFAFVRLYAVSRSFTWLARQWDGELDSLPALLQTVEKTAKNLEKVQDAVKRLIDEGRSHFKRVGLVRYDAFDGVAGQQSYSLCLLDDNHNGLLLSNLVGRDFSRSYAVEIADGKAPRKLGDEEIRALHLALSNVTR